MLRHGPCVNNGQSTVYELVHDFLKKKTVSSMGLVLFQCIYYENKPAGRLIYTIRGHG